MSEVNTPREISVICKDLQSLADCLTVWKTLYTKGTRHHFAGMTEHAIAMSAEISDRRAAEALERLTKCDESRGCLELKECQIGTGQSTITHYTCKQGIMPVFTARLWPDETYRIGLQM